MPRLTCTLLSLIALGVLTGAAMADNWGRFRGPNGTGEVADKNIPLTFSDKENVIWKVATPGSGAGSPVVWGKRLFMQAATKNAAERALVCIDTTDGKTLWTKTIPGSAIKLSRKDTSHASATPATDGEGVYIPFWNGKEIILSAYDFKGNELWTKNLGKWISQHGAGASPIIYKDKLIFCNDMDKLDPVTKEPVPVERPAVLFALNKKTGKVVWEMTREAERTCYSAPFLLTQPGHAEPELVMVSTHAITGYNLDTGSMNWEAKGWQGNQVRMPLRTVATSPVADGVLMACSGDGAGDRFACAIALPGIGKTDVPKQLWHSKEFPYVPCPLVKDGHFYFVNDAGFAGCFEARSGKRIWFERLADTLIYASPLLIDGKVYAVNGAGEVFVFSAEPNFRLLARNELHDRVRATPAVADGRLYIRGDQYLFCIGKASAK